MESTSSKEADQVVGWRVKSRSTSQALLLWIFVSDGSDCSEFCVRWEWRQSCKWERSYRSAKGGAVVVCWTGPAGQCKFFGRIIDPAGQRRGKNRVFSSFCCGVYAWQAWPLLLPHIPGQSLIGCIHKSSVNDSRPGPNCLAFVQTCFLYGTIALQMGFSGPAFFQALTPQIQRQHTSAMVEPDSWSFTCFYRKFRLKKKHEKHCAPWVNFSFPMRWTQHDCEWLPCLHDFLVT